MEKGKQFFLLLDIARCPAFSLDDYEKLQELFNPDLY